MRKYFLLWVVTLGIYLFLSSKGTLIWKTRFESYLNLQAYSWLQKRFDLVFFPKSTFDLSIYNNKVYTYWPPFPAVFVIPFVYLFGIFASDIFYTSLFGSFGSVLMLLVLESAMQAKLIPKISQRNLFVLSIFFSFGTVFFYLSNVGSVWFTSQIISIEMLLISLIFLFRFAGNKRNIFFVLSIVFLCFAFWSRNTLILSLPLYLFILLHHSDATSKKRLLISTVIIISISTILFGFYNYVRFGSFTENGLKFQTFNERWQQDVNTYGLSSMHYFPHNAYYFLIQPISFQLQYPYIIADPEGASIFLTSPLFIGLFGLATMNIFLKKNRNLLVFLFTVILLILPQLFYYGTGWVQFGYRYALDAIPFLILTLAWVFGVIPSSILYLLVLLSVVINTFGVFWMQKLTEKLLY